jgi:hypothetical protein
MAPHVRRGGVRRRPAEGAAPISNHGRGHGEQR